MAISFDEAGRFFSFLSSFFFFCLFPSFSLKGFWWPIGPMARHLFNTYDIYIYLNWSFTLPGSSEHWSFVAFRDGGFKIFIKKWFQFFLPVHVDLLVYHVVNNGYLFVEAEVFSSLFFLGKGFGWPICPNGKASDKYI